MNKKNHFWKMVLFLGGFYVLIISARAYMSTTMVVSLSSDGRYVISTHRDHRLVMDDRHLQKTKLISRHANIYSAYFIPETSRYLWQDLNGRVHVQTIEGKETLFFDNFPTYGQRMSQDYRYYSVNQAWDVHEGWGAHQIKLNDHAARAGFLGYAKLLDLVITQQGLVTAGFGTEEKRRVWSELTVWKDHHPQILNGHYGQIVVALSPTEKWMITGDANNLLWKWRWDHLEDRTPWNTWSLQWPSWGEAKALRYRIHAIVALKFIDEHHCLCFIRGLRHYVLLFDTEKGNEPIYLYVSIPLPVQDYVQARAIETAPRAHVLAYGWKNRVVVYKFADQKFRLE